MIYQESRMYSRKIIPYLVIAYVGGAMAWHLPAHAQQSTTDQDHDVHHRQRHDELLEEVVVTATPIARTVVEMSQSATVLSNEALGRELNNNIGETLTRLPGLSSASFGQNIGRPVIRGMQGVRVGVLNDNMTSADAAAVSQDHAVPTEPFLADQVEVLRGPATLIYGSGAIGGVVNMVSDVIPTVVPEDGVEGRVMTQFDTASDQKFGAGRIDFGAGNFAVHANAFYRRTDDYEIPGYADLYDDDDHDDHDEDHDEDHEHEEETYGVLENSFLDNDGGAIGVSWIGENWTAGMSYTLYDSDYGIPGAHSHAHGEEKDHHDDEHDEDEHDEDHEDEDHDEHDEEELVTIGLESQRYNGLVIGENPFAGFERLKFNVAVTDYTHTEYEGDEIGTVFDSDTTDARLELRHNPFNNWTGAFGGQWTNRDFSAVGEEAFVPPSETDTWALFWVESVEFDSWRLDFGIRYEDVSIDSFLLEHHHEEEEDHDHDEEEHEEEAEAVSRGFSPLSFSAAAVWHVTDASHLAFTFASAERAPTDGELFSNGPHIASQTFEIGDPNLKVETNRHYEASWRTHGGPFSGSISLYYNDFDNYIYEADTGEMEDGFPVREWSQQDAEFTGGEIEVRWDVASNETGHWQLFGFYDRVKAELADGSNVPRIPPQRFGLGVDWDRSAWAGNITWINADSHTDTAEFETPTPGYDLLNAELSYRFPLGDRSMVEIYLKGKNLLDEDIRNSTSLLKDQAPQIGRNYILGARFAF